MADTEILPDWAARYIQENILEHMHVVNVLPMDEGAAQGWLLNTSKGAVVVSKGRLREPRHWFLPLPGDRVSFRCHRCAEAMELVDPDVPRAVHCSACGKRHYLIVQGGELEVVDEQAETGPDPGPTTPATAPPATPRPGAERGAAPDDDGAPAGGPFRHRGYTLHKRRVALKGGGTQDIYFFAKSKPKSGRPCRMPDGYEVGVNERTGLPFLRRAGQTRDQCGALTQDGKQCLRAARKGSKYCHAHKGYQPPSRTRVDELSDTPPRAKGTDDSLPGQKGAQCAALTADGRQCTNRSRAGSKYCGTHKATRGRQKALDTHPRRGMRDTQPSVRRHRKA